MSSTDALDPLDGLARLLLAEHSLESVMTAVAEVATQLVPAGEQASVTVVVERGPVTVATTGPVALALDERQYEHERGPCLTSAHTGDVVVIDDITVSDPRWPAFTASAVSFGVGSSMSVPVLSSTAMRGAINMYSKRSAAFGEAEVALGKQLAERASAALSNMHLYEAQAQVAEQLREAMQSRAVIEQAKGIVMADRRVGADEAFAVLVDLSQRSNRKLREVAAALVSSATQR